jgi:hypothetical protein
LSLAGFRLSVADRKVAMSASLTPRPVTRPLWAAAVALLLAGTTLLWVHYGSAVFFETIRAGYVACFG